MAAWGLAAALTLLAAGAGPNSITAEDETYLAENLRALMPSGVPFTYDRATGMVSVTYSDGTLLEKDFIVPPNAKDPIYERVPGDHRPSGLKFGSRMAFQASDRGCFLLPIPFEERVTMEYRVDLGIIPRGSRLASLLMAFPDGAGAIAVDFGTVEIWHEGKRTEAWPPSDPPLREDPNRWWIKIRTVGMKVEYKPSEQDAGKAQVEIWYDTDGDPVAPINIRLLPKQDGLVGFSWSEVKFRVLDLKVTGKLDKRAALASVRKKLSAIPPGGSAPGQKG